MNSPDATAKSPTNTGSSGPRPLVIVSAITLFVLLSLWTTAARDYWGDETATAQATRETAEQLPGQEALIPTIAGEPHFDQPLYYWLAAASNIVITSIGGHERLAMRLPAALFAALSLWLTLHLGTYLFDRRVGFLAMVIQATSCLYFIKTSWLSSALSFACLCQLATTGWILAQDGRDPKLAARWRRVFWLGLSGACLAGSPLTATALVFFAGASTAFFSGGISAIKVSIARLARGKTRFAILIPLAWYVYAGIQFPDDRTIWITGGPNAIDGASATFSSCAWIILWGFFPWIIFLPLGLLHGKDRLKRLGERLSMCWIFSSLIVFFLLPGDRAAHVLFIWPALSLLIPAALYEEGEAYSVWEDFFKKGLPRLLPYVLRVPLVVVVITTLLWLTGLLSSWVEPRLAAQLESSGDVWRIIFLMSVGGGGCFWIARRIESLVAAGEAPTAVFESSRALLFLLIVIGWTLPFFDASESPRDFLAEVRSRVGEASLVSYGSRRPAALPLYLGSQFEHIPQLDPRAEEGEPNFEARRRLGDYLNRSELSFLLISQTEYEGLGIQSTVIYRQLHETGLEGRLDGSRRYLLLANQELPGAESERTEPTAADPAVAEPTGARSKSTEPENAAPRSSAPGSTEKKDAETKDAEKKNAPPKSTDPENAAPNTTGPKRSETPSDAPNNAPPPGAGSPSP